MSCKTFRWLILFALMVASTLMASSPAAAQTYKVLYGFTGNTNPGPEPGGPLSLDRAGNLFGTTFFGGDLSCNSPLGCGMVFRLNPAGKLESESLNGVDGQGPVGGVVFDSRGNAYGSGSTGGDPTCNPGTGCGTVYKVNRSGTLSALYAFTGTDGNQPVAGVTITGGKLFGVTVAGGSGNLGTIFSLDSSGAESVLHSFDGTDGSTPDARLIADSSGNLYGTTSTGGGPNLGVAFQLATSNNLETVLHVFLGPPSDGY